MKTMKSFLARVYRRYLIKDITSKPIPMQSLEREPLKVFFREPLQREPLITVSVILDQVNFLKDELKKEDMTVKAFVRPGP